MREPFQLDVSSMSDETKSGSEVREGSRIAKVMARAGLCSRRDAEAWIAAGRVSVNGKVLESPAYNVSDVDDVRVDGQRLGAPERTRLFLFHKPRGLVTTARDPEGRPTIFDALPSDLPRVVAIGRLDINTEGLLLLTNDGGLARVLELPATGWLRRYRVRVHGSVDQARLDSLSGGISLDGVDYAAIEAKLDREQGSNAWITMGLREGKNREIKKVLEHLGLAVNRLIRISFGPFELGDLAEGEVAEVRTRVLRDQLGGKLAREAGVDFDAPLIERGAASEEPPAETPRREARGRREGAADERAPDGRRGRQRPDRPFQREEGPRRSPPAPSTPELRRKHVSALRAEIAADGKDAAAPRKRIERSATHDRKGRTVAVERVLPTGEELARRAAAESYGRGKSAERGGAREPSERSRRAGAFDPRSKRDGDARERPPRAEFNRGARSDDRSARGSRDGPPPKRRSDHAEGKRPPRPEFKSRGERSEGRPPRKESRQGAPRAGGEAPRSAADRPPRSEFKPRGPRSENRPARAPSRDGEPRERRFERPQGERPPRRFEGGGRGAAAQSREKPPRSDFKPRGPRSEDRPARAPSRDGPPRERRFDRSEGERAPKRFEARSPRSAGPGRSSGGRPPGKGGSKGPGKGSRGAPRRPPGKP
jgi:23S rRNA pseudouridine2605 synthase